MNKIGIASWDELEDRKPAHALVAGVDLVIVRFDDDVSVLYGRCAHRGALMADGFVRGDDIICGVHNWDYEFRSGEAQNFRSGQGPNAQVDGIDDVIAVQVTGIWSQ